MSKQKTSIEKSKMQYIKEYIETCPLLKGNKINVDYLKDKEYSYSIDRTPVNPVVKQYTDGASIKQIAFDFSITFPIVSVALYNLMNSKFCDDFMDWIESQNNKRNLPGIEGARSIRCTSPGYILSKSETTAIYIIQMNCQYYEKKLGGN